MKEDVERIPRKTKDTAHRVLADKAIVVNFKSSFFYNINSVGTFIYDRCDGHHTLAQIAAALAAEYEVTPEVAAADCREYIDGLVSEGLLEWLEGR